jgi:hypothetical protein
VIFFYELLFVAIAIGAIVLGETVSRTLAVALVGVVFAISVLGVWSFDARLTTNGVSDDDRRWFVDARDGLKHLRLLLAVGCAAALVWRLIAG